MLGLADPAAASTGVLWEAVQKRGGTGTRAVLRGRVDGLDRAGAVM
jgi:hypothetical protein